MSIEGNGTHLLAFLLLVSEGYPPLFSLAFPGTSSEEQLSPPQGQFSAPEVPFRLKQLETATLFLQTFPFEPPFQ
jgi:hypothetical protein